MITPAWLLVCAALMGGTYLVRALPFWFPWIESLPVSVRRFLDAVPAAALGALILPDALVGTPPLIAGAVVVIAFLMALRGAGITMIVAVTVTLAWIGITLV